MRRGRWLLAPRTTNVELSEMMVEINNFGMGISGKSTGYVNWAALLPRKSKRPHSPAFAPGLPPRLKQLGRDKTRAGSGDGHDGSLGGAGCPTRQRPLTLQPYVKEQGAQARLTHYTSTVGWECKWIYSFYFWWRVFDRGIPPARRRRMRSRRPYLPRKSLMIGVWPGARDGGLSKSAELLSSANDGWPP